jgi:hypothetical protein
MMKLGLLIVTMSLLGHWAIAQQATPSAGTPIPGTPPTAKTTLPSLRGKLIYKPIGRGAPAGRVDAGSRGDGDDVASLYVLAPEHVGLTTHSQPTLFWYQTAPAKLPFEISILKPNDPKPVLRVRRSDATTSGFQHLDLSTHGVSLAPGVDYQWVVALVRDPQSRSRDIISSGWIRHVGGKDGHRDSDPAAYAADGIWYDAVSTLFDKIAAHPSDAQLAADRRDLFTQVGLPALPTVNVSKRP